MPLPDILLQFDHLRQEFTSVSRSARQPPPQGRIQRLHPGASGRRCRVASRILDKVCLFNVRTLLTLPGLSIPAVLPVLRPGNAYVNSEVFVAPGECCRLGAYSKLLFRFSAHRDVRSPPEVLAMSTRGCWTAQGFMSGGRGSTLKNRGRLRRCVDNPTVFPISHS